MSITLNWQGSPLVLALVNQDGYSSEYRNRTDSNVTTCFVRHTKTNKKDATGSAIERHNIEVTHKNLATGSTPEQTFKVYAVIEVAENAALGSVVYPAEAIGTLLSDDATIGRLLGWQPS